jgi:hypothetical protein
MPNYHKQRLPRSKQPIALEDEDQGPEAEVVPHHPLRGPCSTNSRKSIALATGQVTVPALPKF